MTKERHSPEWLIENADHGIAFEVACASALQRLQAENAELQQQLDAISAGGVGPLVPAAVPQPDPGTQASEPTGWKLAPVEPTREMLDAAAHISVCRNDVYRAMLAAAPQPPAPGCKATQRGDQMVCDDCKSAWDANDQNPPACLPAPPAVEQPARRKAGQVVYPLGKLMDDEIARVKAKQTQGEQQEPVAWVVWWGIGEMRLHERLFKTKAEAKAFASEVKSNTEIRPVSYTHPQPRQPLTDEEITQICVGLWSGGWREKAMKDFARAIERAHGIGGEA